MTEVLARDTVVELRAAAGRFSKASAARKAGLLRRCRNAAIDDPATLLALHDCLLFLLAYPQTPELLATAGDALLHVARESKRLTGRSRRDRWMLEHTGVAWAEPKIAVSYPIARWLAERHPEDAEIAFFSEGGQPLATVLQFCMPAAEISSLDPERSSEDLLEELSHGYGGSRLAWLTGRLAAAPCSEEIREHLFESLRAHVGIRLGDGTLSRTFARGLPREPYFHREELSRHVDPVALVSEPLPASRPLTGRERVHLLDTARSVLTSVARETETIDTCTPAGVEQVELERGISIALYWMPPERRLPIDSHVGFVVFKNGMPMAYGGGWPFLGLCRIGIHVFAPYRGGETAYAFCQALRVFRQRFGAARFLAEPSQFGGKDREGLESGAFWFYYRLGFRPVDRRLAQAADREFERLAADREHRTAIRALRRLAGAELELVLPGADPETTRCDPGQLSLAVTAWIERRYWADRAAAERAAVASVSRSLGVEDMGAWPEEERRSFASLSLVVDMIPGLDGWPSADRRRLVAIMRAKGRPREQAYFDMLLGHRRLARALTEMAELSAASSP